MYLANNPQYSRADLLMWAKYSLSTRFHHALTAQNENLWNNAG